MELADNQLGFSTQDDQRKYLDVEDYTFRLLNLTQTWELAQKSNRTQYNYTLPQPTELDQTGQMGQSVSANKTSTLNRTNSTSNKPPGHDHSDSVEK